MSSIQKTNLFVLFLFVLQFILGLFWYILEKKQFGGYKNEKT